MDDVFSGRKKHQGLTGLTGLEFSDEEGKVEARAIDGGADIDELIVTVGGRVVFHLERMADDAIWMRASAGGHTIDVNLVSDEGIKARVDADL